MFASDLWHIYKRKSVIQIANIMLFKFYLINVLKFGILTYGGKLATSQWCIPIFCKVPHIDNDISFGAEGLRGRLVYNDYGWLRGL